MLKHAQGTLYESTCYLQDALEVALQMALSMPLADIMAFRKVRSAALNPLITPSPLHRASSSLLRAPFPLARRPCAISLAICSVSSRSNKILF